MVGEAKQGQPGGKNETATDYYLPAVTVRRMDGMVWYRKLGGCGGGLLGG